MESLNRFHSYFTGLGQAFTTSAIAAALSKDDWAETFYIDKDDKAATILKEILNALGTIIGLVGAFAGVGPTVSVFLVCDAITVILNVAEDQLPTACFPRSCFLVAIYKNMD